MGWVKYLYIHYETTGDNFFYMTVFGIYYFPTKLYIYIIHIFTLYLRIINSGKINVWVYV